MRFGTVINLGNLWQEAGGFIVSDPENRPEKSQIQ